MFSLLLSVSMSLCCYCMYMFTSVTSSSFVLPCFHFMCLTVYMYDSICMVGMCPHISMNSYRSIRCDFHTMFFSVIHFHTMFMQCMCMCRLIYIFIQCSAMFFPVHTIPYYVHIFPYYASLFIHCMYIVCNLYFHTMFHTVFFSSYIVCVYT